MDVGLSLGLVGFDPGTDAARCLRAEELGFRTIWVAESTGPDAYVVATWALELTSRIRVATGVAQAFTRTPAATSMVAGALRQLYGTRFELGLGSSTPDILERLHGIAVTMPVARLEEYIEVVRSLCRREPATGFERFYSVAGNSFERRGHLMKTITPLELTIVVAANGPIMAAMAAKRAEGLLTLFHTPSSSLELRACIEEPTGFRTAALVPAIVTPDVAHGISLVQEVLARYLSVGGDSNPYVRLAQRLGFVSEVAEIRERAQEEGARAIASLVPADWVDEASLIGPLERIARRVRDWAESGLDELVIAGYGDGLLERVADAAR